MAVICPGTRYSQEALAGRSPFVGTAVTRRTAGCLAFAALILFLSRLHAQDIHVDSLEQAGGKPLKSTVENIQDDEENLKLVRQVVGLLRNYHTWIKSQSQPDIKPELKLLQFEIDTGSQIEVRLGGALLIAYDHLSGSKEQCAVNDGVPLVFAVDKDSLIIQVKESGDKAAIKMRNDSGDFKFDYISLPAKSGTLFKQAQVAFPMLTEAEALKELSSLSSNQKLMVMATWLKNKQGWILARLHVYVSAEKEWNVQLEGRQPEKLDSDDFIDPGHQDMAYRTFELTAAQTITIIRGASFHLPKPKEAQPDTTKPIVAGVFPVGWGIRSRMETALTLKNDSKNAVRTGKTEETPFWLRDTIQTIFKHGHLMDSLDLKPINGVTLAKLDQLIHEEQEISEGIERRMTDNDTSLPILLERAEDLLLHGEQIELMMITVPIVDLNLMDKHFHLPGLADNFKERLHRTLRDEGIDAAMRGGRIIILTQGADQVAAKIPELIDQVRGEFAEDQAKLLHPDSDRPDYLKQMEQLHFDGSRARVYFLPNKENKETLPLDPDNPAFELQLERGKPEALAQSADVQERIVYYDNYNTYLGRRRSALASSALFYLQKDLGIPAVRRKASRLVELLLDDAIKKLYERVEVTEKTTHPELRHRLDAELNARNGSLHMGSLQVLDDEVIRSLMDNLYVEHRDDLVAELFKDLQKGRAKSLPLFSADKPRFPRLLHAIPGWKQKDQPGGDLLGAFDRLKTAYAAGSSNTVDALQDFRQVYIRYRIASGIALMKSYTDPRCPKIFKLDRIDELAAAAQADLLEPLQSHLLTLAARLDPNDPERDVLKRILDFKPRGPWAAKRAVGDEGMFIGQDRRGRFYTAFWELNQANARYELYPTDDQDSLYHSILDHFRVQIETLWDPSDPIRSMSAILATFDPLLKELAPQPFSMTAKVINDQGAAERMPLYNARIKDKETVQRVVIDRLGQMRAMPSGKILEEGTQPYTFEKVMTTLTASKVFNPIPVHAGDLRRAFEELDTLVGEQKKNDFLIHQIVNAQDLQQGREKIVQSLLERLARKHIETREHIERVADLAVKMGERMGLDSAQLQDLRDAALLHDIGKLRLSRKYLNAGPYNKRENFLKFLHVIYGAVILLPHIRRLWGVIKIVLTHQEKWDGTGYPLGILSLGWMRGARIPIGARIIEVIDAFDAMTDPKRTYKKTYTREEAAEELIRKAGTQFDPEVVSLFLELNNLQPGTDSERPIRQNGHSKPTADEALSGAA